MLFDFVQFVFLLKGDARLFKQLGGHLFVRVDVQSHTAHPLTQNHLEDEILALGLHLDCGLEPLLDAFHLLFAQIGDRAMAEETQRTIVIDVGVVGMQFDSLLQGFIGQLIVFQSQIGQAGGIECLRVARVLLHLLFEGGAVEGDLLRREAQRIDDGGLDAVFGSALAASRRPSLQRAGTDLTACNFQFCHSCSIDYYFGQCSSSITPLAKKKIEIQLPTFSFIARACSAAF